MKTIDYLSIGKPCPNCRLVAISPKLAEEWLQRNTLNRPLNHKNINCLIRALEKKEWRINGETITFSSNGELLQGQHRLYAIWQSGITAQSYVVFDIQDADAFVTYDSGKSRNASDVLSIDKKTNVKKMAALAIRLIWWEKGLLTENSMRASNRDSKPSSKDILEYCRKNDEEMQEAIRFVSDIDNATSTCLSHAYFIFNRIDRDKCLVFFSRLKTGEMLSSGSPILTLRNEFTRRKVVARDSESRSEVKAVKLTPYETMAYLIKAWNAYYCGREMKKINFPRDEQFPMPLDDKLFGSRKQIKA